MAVLLGSHAVDRGTLVVAPSRAIEVAVAGGCHGARLSVSIDATRRSLVTVGSAAWHTVTIAKRVAGGTHRLKLSATYPAHHHLCPVTRVSQLDFLPARRADDVVLGAAVRAPQLADPRYSAAFVRDFGSLTPEDAMKMLFTQPAPGVYELDQADQLVDFAVAHGDAVRGHTLVYGDQLPGWLTSPAVPWTSASLLVVMRDFITTMMQHFAGRVTAWDVVNEAFNDDGSYKRNVWYDVIGPSYIAQAFRFARAADPTARLFYNDIAAETDDAKYRAIRAMAEDFIARGVPIDAIGLQNHTNLFGYPTEAQLEHTIGSYAELGLHVEITEMDVGVSGYPGSPAAAFALQADAYRQAARACWTFVACTRLTTWGFTDAVSWIGPAQAALPLDAGYAPKPAYAALLHALHIVG
jgi:endo-1,4-beta-xylanase